MVMTEDRTEQELARLQDVNRALSEQVADLMAQRERLRTVLTDMVTSYRPAPKSAGAIWLVRARAALAEGGKP